MDTKRIKLGIAIWFLGIIVPILHHVILVTAMAKERVAASSIDELFRHLPWIDLAYLLAMAIVGAILIATGMRESSQ